MSAKKILITNDDATVRLTIRKFLQSAKEGDFEIYEAANGVECLMVVERDGPMDLILLDVEMPDMDGPETCRAIRNVDTRVPIVFVTAHAEVEHRVSAREAGGDSYLIKPVRPASLMSVIQMFLSSERRHPRRVAERRVPGNG